MKIIGCFYVLFRDYQGKNVCKDQKRKNVIFYEKQKKFGEKGKTTNNEIFLDLWKKLTNVEEMYDQFFCFTLQKMGKMCYETTCCI